MVDSRVFVILQTFIEKQTAEPQRWLTNLIIADLNSKVSDDTDIIGWENTRFKKKIKNKTKQMVNELWGAESSIYVGLSCLFTELLAKAVPLP